jgi:putative protease
MRKIELLAPGGDLDSIKAAIAAGADAVYCGLDRFNARNRAENLSFDKLQGVIRLAHRNNCMVFLTLNIVFVDSEIPSLVRELNRLVNSNIDGVILQDLGLFFLISRFFPGLNIHASTQMTTHNVGQVKFLSRLGAKRVNLSRELNIREVRSLTEACRENNIQSEVFVHGSYCISFSGLCYMSSVMRGNSGNRGRCSQPCRDQYETTMAGKKYPLNMKDNSAFHDLEELHEAGVDSLKIEGRIKGFDYVYTVVKTWKDRIDAHQDKTLLTVDDSALYKVFNRSFSNSFLKGDISRDMFIDNPRDNSIASGQEGLYEEQIRIKTDVKRIIEKIDIGKAPVRITVSGKIDEPLTVVVNTPDESFTVLSDLSLTDKGTEALNPDVILSKLKSLNETEFYIEALDLDGLEEDLYLPFKELTSIRKRILFLLNGLRENVAPAQLPDLQRSLNKGVRPGLSVLISDENDIAIYEHRSATIYFKVPAGLDGELPAQINFFKLYPDVIPWFPPVLIGKDYRAALDFLEELSPKLIVTNNTGIANAASDRGIAWIAGPYMNVTNSYSLLCLKELPGCRGAFISNELNQYQIRSIRKPEGFDLYFSIYHPIVLMTSRQCLSHQVEGCKKSIIDGKCISDCTKNSFIRNMQGESFVIDKRRGNYHTVFNEHNYLNTRVVNDYSDMFSGFFIDLTDIKTNTEVSIDKIRIIELFEGILNGEADSLEELAANISGTTCRQYVKGI